MHIIVEKQKNGGIRLHFRTRKLVVTTGIFVFGICLLTMNLVNNEKALSQKDTEAKSEQAVIKAEKLELKSSIERNKENDLIYLIGKDEAQILSLLGKPNRMDSSFYDFQ